MGRSFLPPPDETDPEVRRLYDADLAEDGFVMNLTRLWAHQPGVHDALWDFAGAAGRASGLSLREKDVLIAAMAATVGDSYCALAWGNRLAEAATPEVSAAVLRGDDSALHPREQALARWARRVAAAPASTTPEDVASLRAAGFSDAEVVAVTAYLAARLAFAAVNDALGARPDRELVERAPDGVLDAVDFGRPAVED